MSERLDSLVRLREVVAAHFDQLLDGPIEADGIYCPRCSGTRRVKIRELKLLSREPGAPRRNVMDFGAPSWDPSAPAGDTPEKRALRLLEERMAPALFVYECNQCLCEFTAVVYKGPEGDELAVFPSVLGGLATKHTPSGVAYYLDQGARSQAGGARSAAIAMYRCALEHLLEEQGFKERMCGPKIEALERQIKAGNAPKWAVDIDPDMMKILSWLGNGVLHTNGGDITLQENATSELLEQIALALEELLDYVYERPAAAEARKSSLRAVALKMKK